MATYRYTDLEDAPVIINVPIGELKRLAKVLRSLPDDHEDRYFARNRAREFEEMVRTSGDSMKCYAEDYAKFGRSED